MNLFEEVKFNWENDIINNWQTILSLKDSYPAWTIKTYDCYGVAIPYAGEDVREDFSNATIHCEYIKDGGNKQKILALFSKTASFDAAFANLCFDFINPGENGDFRRTLIANPVNWWASWKELLGNVSIDERVYDVIGELSVLKYYAENGHDPIWNGPSQSSYDIETDDFFVEVKSSINRTKKEVTISSIYQLSNLEKNLYLVFCTFELTDSHGISINSLVEDLRLLGYNVAAINELLEKKGFGIGKSVRKKQFLLHSMVDEGRIAFTPAVELSYLNEIEQQDLVDAIGEYDATPNLSQACRFKKMSTEGQGLTPEIITEILKEQKANQKPMFKIHFEKLREVAPIKDDSDFEAFVLEACKRYYKHLERQKARER